jgi:phosphomannomutase
VTDDDLAAQVTAWLADDPDERDRAELAALAADDSEQARAELADRFAGRLQFGTAGLRGAVGAGPNRMNRAVVRGTTAALASWLLGRAEDGAAAAQAGVVIGCDARHRSDEFAAEAASVLAGAGFRVHLLPPQQPTPLLAFAVRRLRAAARLIITATHKPAPANLPATTRPPTTATSSTSATARRSCRRPTPRSRRRPAISARWRRYPPPRRTAR